MEYAPEHFISIMMPAQKMEALKTLRQLKPPLVRILNHELMTGNVISRVWREDERIEVSLSRPFQTKHEDTHLNKYQSNTPHDAAEYFEIDNQTITAPLGKK